MSRWHTVVIAPLLLVLTGCGGVLRSGVQPPRYYDVAYPSPPTSCENRPLDGVRIWPFSATAPYDREQMIVLGLDTQVRFSSQYRWITLPGDMVADRLLRDLAASELLGHVVASGSQYETSLALGGHVFRFAWEDRGEAYRAVLDVEVFLWREVPRRDLLFRKHYRLQGEPVVEGGPEAFAQAMSGLVQNLSVELRQDLCRLPKDSSSRASD